MSDAHTEIERTQVSNKMNKSSSTVQKTERIRALEEVETMLCALGIKAHNDCQGYAKSLLVRAGDKVRKMLDESPKEEPSGWLPIEKTKNGAPILPKGAFVFGRWVGDTWSVRKYWTNSMAPFTHYRPDDLPPPPQPLEDKSDA